MGYHEICLNINNGWTKVKGDECTVGPYAYNDNQWIGYDDLETVKVKVKFSTYSSIAYILTYQRICLQFILP